MDFCQKLGGVLCPGNERTRVVHSGFGQGSKNSFVKMCRAKEKKLKIVKLGYGLKYVGCLLYRS